MRLFLESVEEGEPQGLGDVGLRENRGVGVDEASGAVLGAALGEDYGERDGAVGVRSVREESTEVLLGC